MSSRKLTHFILNGPMCFYPQKKKKNWSHVPWEKKFEIYPHKYCEILFLYSIGIWVTRDAPFSANFLTFSKTFFEKLFFSKRRHCLLIILLLYKLLYFLSLYPSLLFIYLFYSFIIIFPSYHIWLCLTGG